MAGTQSKQWVLLVAGSNGWSNYRHQADVCHAYQMVHNNGIPDEQVVVMMFDDIAYNAHNPHKGEIINEPGGPNVYLGVPKHYTGQDVSFRNFLAVLSGDEADINERKLRPNKVLKSGKNDTIFIYLSDHGASGSFLFPNDTLYAYEFLYTINKMAERQQFSKMVIYIEACNSGSMLDQLPENTQVYGVSAAKPCQNSNACFFDRDRMTYLTDEFTANWLLHCKKSDLTKTTFQAQFKYLKDNVTSSNPCQYGDKELSKLHISDFLGCPDAETQAAHTLKASTFKPTHLTPSHKVTRVLLSERIERETDPMRKNDLLNEHHNHNQKKREKIREAVRDIATCVRPQIPSLTYLRNMKDVAEHFRETFSECLEEQEDTIFFLSQMHVFEKLLKDGATVERIKDAITHVYQTTFSSSSSSQH